MVDVDEKDNINRRNYKKADNINYLDGDWASSIYFDEEFDKDKSEKAMYNYGASSMLNDKARVYKGGSWKDRAYWMSPGTRRYLDEEQATDFIGFIFHFSSYINKIKIAC